MSTRPERRMVDSIGENEFAGFFIILREDDQRLKRHSVEIDAVKEAERLAVTNPGHRFIVLEATRARRVERPLREELAVFEVPF